ncbi:hypothetical protein VM1G_07780 [Cytospora mali]|uniref:endo-polygalacturonase n=1 Tax=Cytospora mali TaxID=578113 RepID=A0A194W6Y6_CYTMA|nr:hypothetical protein VM1G_07780 [Valsa mali]
MISSKFSPMAVAAFAATVLASPVAEPGPAVTAAPDIKRATTCTFSGSSGASLASVSQKDCATIVLSAVAVPSGTTLNLSDLSEGTHVIFEGETTWGYEEWDGPLLQIEGTSITIEGATDAYLNADGSRWWDGKGSNGGKTKPKFFAAHNLVDSTITNLYIQNTPVQAVSIDGADGLTITDMTIDNSDGDTDELGHNTDCFDIGDSSTVTITGANCYNQDDCVAINSGTGITFENGVCSGGHGLSIGSVGGRTDNTVETVTFYNNEIKNSANGIRVKATKGDTGTIKGVTYKEITLSGISDYGILIEQNYDGGDLKGTPTSGIPITDLTIENISGSDAVSSDGYNVVIVCGSSGCSDWTWSDVSVSGGKTYSDCENAPDSVTC